MAIYLPLILFFIVLVPQFLPIHPGVGILLSALAILALTVLLQAPVYPLWTAMAGWAANAIEMVSAIISAAILALVVHRFRMTTPTSALTALYGTTAAMAFPTAYGIGRTIWPTINQAGLARFDVFVAGFALFTIGTSLAAAFLVEGVKINAATVDILLRRATLTPIPAALLVLVITEWRNYTNRPPLSLAPYLWLLAPWWLNVATYFCYLRGYFGPTEALFIYLLIAALMVAIAVKASDFKGSWPILREGVLTIGIIISTIIIPRLIVTNLDLYVSPETAAYAQAHPWTMKGIIAGLLIATILLGFVLEYIIVNMIFGHLVWLSFDTSSLNGKLLLAAVICAALIGFVMPKIGLLDRRRIQPPLGEKPTLLRWIVVAGLTIIMLLLVILPDTPLLMIDRTA